MCGGGQNGGRNRRAIVLPALNRLLGALGDLATPRITPISDPAAREGDFPDVVCWDSLSAVCALPVEVKPAFFSEEDLLALDQGPRYARSFRGGRVLLTNLRTFLLREMEGGSLVALPKPLRWLVLFGLLPIPGPVDEAILLIPAPLLYVFGREPMRDAWQRADPARFARRFAGPSY